MKELVLDNDGFDAEGDQGADERSVTTVQVFGNTPDRSDGDYMYPMLSTQVW